MKSIKPINKQDLTSMKKFVVREAETLTPFPPEDFVFGGKQGMRSHWWPTH